MKQNQPMIKTHTRGELLNDLSNSQIVERLKAIFKRSIGKENAVIMPEIYQYVYENNYGMMAQNKFQYIVQCQRILGLINFLKKTTRYFIVGEWNNAKEYEWYVVSNQEESDTYKHSVDSKIKGLEQMKERCDIAIREKYHENLDKPIPKKKKYDIEG